MNIKSTNGDGRSKPSHQSATGLGRTLLENWLADQPDNYFTRDLNLQRSLEYHWGTERYGDHVPALINFGAVLATVVNRLVAEANQQENAPRLERFGAHGKRIEQISFHPSHHEAGRHIYNSGMMSVYEQPGNNLLSLAMFYLSAQNGEAGHNCPAACTAGLIKVLQALGDPTLQNKYLPRLLDPDYDRHFSGAQYLTEVQGGSDVGANDTRATRVDPNSGVWLLNGEKWFCSNVSADLALVTARVDGQGQGTRGLGLFLLPRRLEDGSLNGAFIHRLKDKLGTRSLATAELELRDALAYQVGPTESGFKNVMRYVINTSRIYNAAAVSGNARRAYVTARTYAENRSAFGRSIIHFPLVQDQLANMRAASAAMLSGTLQILRTMDEVELGKSDERTDGFLRLAINLNKYRSAVLAHNVIVQAIEMLGGNGAIEDFSILPRLLRDNIVYENWEGTHNVLLAQVQRDIRRYGLDKHFITVITHLIERLADVELSKAAMEQVEYITAELVEVLAMDELTAAIYFRPLMDRLTDLYYSASMFAEGAWAEREKKDRTKLRLAKLFFDRNVLGKEPKDIAYYDDLVSRLCG
jgi:alkylation response protein AidB-like acyl-CoA dehydrogenase